MILSVTASNGAAQDADPEPITKRRMLKLLYRRLKEVSQKRLLNSDQAVREVHRLRVATRKALAALKVCAPLLTKRAAKSIRKSLKAKRKALGQVRDWDVLISRVLCIPADEKAEARCDLLYYLASERHREWRAARKAWAKGDRCCSISTRRKRSGGNENAQALCDRAIRDPLATVQCGVPTGDEMSAPDMESLHQFRIACKSLRYLLEFQKELSGSAAENGEALAILAEVQQRLGDLHDLSRRAVLLTSGKRATSKSVRKWRKETVHNAAERFGQEWRRTSQWLRSIDFSQAFAGLRRGDDTVSR